MAKAIGKSEKSGRQVEFVYCPMCTHTVQAAVNLVGKRLMVQAGQECSHCHSSIDAGYVMRRDRAA